MKEHGRTYFYGIMLVQALMASGTHIVAKIVVADIEPLTLAFLRSLIAAIACGGILAATGGLPRFTRDEWIRLTMLGGLAIPLNQFLFLSGIRQSTAANAALLYGTTPALVMLISVVRGEESLTGVKSTGVFIAFTGVLLIVFEHGLDLGSDKTFGNLLLALAVLSWAFYTILGRPLILKYGAFRTSAATMILGMALFFPFGLRNAAVFPLGNLSMADWGGLLYLAIFTSIAAYFLWYYALGKLEASKVAIFANLQPVITTLLAVLLLNQAISAQFLAGGAIALAGVVLTQRG